MIRTLLCLFLAWAFISGHIALMRQGLVQGGNVHDGWHLVWVTK